MQGGNVQEFKWKKVVRRGDRGNKGKWDILKTGQGVVVVSVSTYFYFDFDESWSAKDLFFEFKEVGEIEEIVIPPKKDWRGKKYGFVRFSGEKDERITETKLDNIMLNGSKISANLSKYKRKENRSSAVRRDTLINSDKDGGK